MDQFQLVRLKTDKYLDRGLPMGTIGVILECYDDDNYEVEFSDDQGITIDLGAFTKDDLLVIDS